MVSATPSNRATRCITSPVTPTVSNSLSGPSPKQKFRESRTSEAWATVKPARRKTITVYSGGRGIGKAFILPNGWRFADDYHTFGVEWSRDSIQFFVDGSPYQHRSPLHAAQRHRVGLQSSLLPSAGANPRSGS